MRLTKAPSPPMTYPVLRDNFDRLVDRFLGGELIPARTTEPIWSPNLDFSETDKEYVVRLEAPGIPKDDLDVNLDGQTLTLSGRRDFANEEKTEDFFWREREQGRFVRVLQLPASVDGSKVEATYNNGIMTVRLPKKEPAGKTQIAIK
jgi:HSP20 family protein